MNAKNNTIFHSLRSVIEFNKLQLQKSWGNIKKTGKNIRFNLLKNNLGDSRVFPTSVIKNELYEGLKSCH